MTTRLANRWINAISLRSDEPKRVERLLTTNKHSNEEPFAPLDEAGLDLEDVQKFWRQSPFDLQLEQHEGNCDLCFLKGKGKMLRIMKEKPELADWWIKMEQLSLSSKKSGARFRNDRPSYAGLLAESKQPSLFDEFECDELSEACHCTD